MDEDYGQSSFELAQHRMPCCNATHTFNELVYEWPQGFARFALEAMNPNIGDLGNLHRTEFDTILGTRLLVIDQHI